MGQTGLGVVAEGGAVQVAQALGDALSGSDSGRTVTVTVTVTVAVTVVVTVTATDNNERMEEDRR